MSSAGRVWAAGQGGLRASELATDIVSFAGAVPAAGSARGTLQLIDAEAMDERVAFLTAEAGPRATEVERDMAAFAPVLELLADR